MARSTRFYATTPIYYVNDVPHLGTAYTTIVVDALRRYHAARGQESRMLTGTDEHGLKIERVAKEHGKSPRAFVDEVSARFRDAWPAFDVETDDFIRTTEPRHTQWAQELWRKIEKAGDIYEGEFEDWYCVGCEGYKTEKDLVQPGNICPLHLKAVEKLKERTFFFRLSRFEKPLLELYARRPELVLPKERRNEVLSFIEGGLRDLSVSRTSFQWGIPVPGRPEHVMYVWFDALGTYRSALGEGELAKFWPATHIVGKDILRFHAAYWPAFLLSAGFAEDELPRVFAHGFLTVDGQKMSKTLGNVVDPLRLARKLGPDTLRYHLLRAIAFGQDGDFDHAALLERYNADLGKNLGNLLNRSLKPTGAKVPVGWEPGPLEEELFATARAHAEEAAKAWDETAPHRALEATWMISSAANQYVDRAAPWKAEGARKDTILATLVAVLGGISVLAWPAMPKKMDAMRAQLGLPPFAPKVGTDHWQDAFARRAPGEALALGAPLFPTYDKLQTAALLAELAPPKRIEAPMTDMKSPSVPPPATRTFITYDQFAAVELKVGIVRSAENVPKKERLLSLKVDVGEESLRPIIAGLALTYKEPASLVGRRVIVVTNLAPRDFGGGLVSFGMLLAAGTRETLTLATVEGDAPPGTPIK